MLKRYIYKKFGIIICTILIILLTYLFPKNNDYIEVIPTYSNIKYAYVYLINEYNYVSRFKIIDNSTNIEDTVYNNINAITINSDTIIPNNFNKVIPKDTKIIDINITDNLLKINFTKDILYINKDMEEKMIESIVYTLTEINGIEKVMIFIEGNILDKLPNSKKIMPTTLDRSYGINKVYDLTSMKDIKRYTTYYIAKDDNIKYYVPVTTYTNDNKEKVEIIIEKLKMNNTWQTNLVSYLSAAATLENYNILENSVNLSFNNEILDLNDSSIIEEVKYSIALSINDTYNIKNTIFYIDDALIDTVFIEK